MGLRLPLALALLGASDAFRGWSSLRTARPGRELFSTAEGAAQPSKASAEAAHKHDRAHHVLPLNAPGNLYVDNGCIDCDACQWLAPDVFGRSGFKAHVKRQPASDDEWAAAGRALAACPTFAIRAKSRVPALATGARSMPTPLALAPVAGVKATNEALPDVFVVGHTTPESNGEVVGGPFLVCDACPVVGRAMWLQ